jgi:hypothetical protein
LLDRSSPGALLIVPLGAEAVQIDELRKIVKIAVVLYELVDGVEVSDDTATRFAKGLHPHRFAPIRRRTEELASGFGLDEESHG